MNGTSNYRENEERIKGNRIFLLGAVQLWMDVASI